MEWEYGQLFQNEAILTESILEATSGFSSTVLQSKPVT